MQNDLTPIGTDVVASISNVTCNINRVDFRMGDHTVYTALITIEIYTTNPREHSPSSALSMYP